MIDALRCGDYLQEGQLVSVQLQDKNDSEDAMTTFSDIFGLPICFGLEGACMFVGGALGQLGTIWYCKYETFHKNFDKTYDCKYFWTSDLLMLSCFSAF